MQSGRWRFLALLGCAAVLLLVADWFTGGVTHGWVQGRAALVVTADPAGAGVRVDGVEQGVAPLTIRVTPGAHTVVVSDPYHLPRVEHVEVARGGRAELNVTLEPAWGSLSVVSNPRGAEVLIDGVAQSGVTPLRLDPIRAGRHTVEVRAPGRVARSEPVEVLPDAETALVVELARSARGRLLVETIPRHAIAELVDADGKVHPADAILPVGDYTLRVRARGYRTLERPHRLLVGERRLAVTLERAP